MKCLVFLILFVAVHAQSDAVIRASFLNGTTSTPYQYKLWVPRGYTNTRSWKLVVWLHGIGERGQANGAQLIRTPVLLAKDVVQNNYPHFILAPILATGSWGAAAIRTLIQHVSGEYNIDQGELRITGFSWGSFGTWDSIMGNAGLFKKAVPIAGGPGGRNWAAVRPTQIWTFHGEADTVVSWTGTRDAVAALTADGQAVIFTHEPNRNHEDGYVWTNYPTPAWFLADNATSATIATSVATSAAACVPACTGNAVCNNGQCACPAGTFPLPNCLNQYIGPDPLRNEGQGSAHLVVIPTAVSATGKVNSLEIFWGAVAPENPQLEFRLYTKDGSSNTADNFTLTFKQAFTTTDFRNDSARTIALNPPVDVQRGQYVALINLGGRLNLPNNPSTNFGYWYISDQSYTSTVGGKTQLSYWNGAPAWRALFAGTAVPTSPTVVPSATRASASVPASSSPLSNSEIVTDTESSASAIIASLVLVAALLLQ